MRKVLQLHCMLCTIVIHVVAYSPLSILDNIMYQLHPQLKIFMTILGQLWFLPHYVGLYMQTHTLQMACKLVLVEHGLALHVMAPLTPHCKSTHLNPTDHT